MCWKRRYARWSLYQCVAQPLVIQAVALAPGDPHILLMTIKGPGNRSYPRYVVSD